MRQKNRILIGLACSPGGHMTQLRQLELLYSRESHFFFTFSGHVADSLRETNKVVSIPNITRYNPFSWFWGSVASFYWAQKLKPDIVISTGAGITVFFCIFSKLAGAKLVFIESMAKVEKPTLTAFMLYPFADLFFVQWPELKTYFPKSKYRGRLF